MAGIRTVKPRRPMTDLERLRALHLGNCTFPVASWAKRFARDMGSVARGVDPAITDREAAALERLAWAYRRQLARAPAGVVPAVKPAPNVAPAFAGECPGQEPKSARVSEKDRRRAEKLARAMKGEW